jgi:hypothetical protein
MIFYAQVNRKYYSMLAGIMVIGSLISGITPKGCARQKPGAQGVYLVKEGPLANLYAVFGN